MNARYADSPVLQEPVTWRFDFDMVFLFEIDLDAIHLTFPRGCFPQEVRPGIGLFALCLETGLAGTHGHISDFVEINWCIVMEPDLSRPMPTPRFCMFTGNVGSDSPAFLDNAASADNLPVYRSRALRTTIDRERFAVSAEDERGPIFSMWSTDLSSQDFQQRTVWVQTLSSQGGEWFQAIRWTGKVWEHQRGHKAAIIHQHPFFEGVDVAGLGDRCYLQMLCPHEPSIVADFYRPAPLRRR